MIIKGFNPSFASALKSSDNERLQKNYGRALVLKNGETEEAKAVNIQRRNQALQKLSELSDDEKPREAGRIYTAMQGMILKSISARQNEIDLYNRYNDKISYYTDLLKRGGDGDSVYVSDKKYEIAEKFSSTDNISKDTIKEYLKDAAESLENMVDSPLPRDDVRNIHNSRSYHRLGMDFEAVTGMSAACLSVDESDDSFFQWQEGLTYDNFVEKKEDAIEKLKARSDGLYSLMQEYKNEKGLGDSDEAFGFVEGYKMNAVDEVRRQFLVTGRILMTEKTAFLLDTLA